MYISIFALFLLGLIFYLRDVNRKRKFEDIRFQEHVYSYDKHRNEITFYYVTASFNKCAILSKIEDDKVLKEKITITKKDVDKYYTMNYTANGLDRRFLMSKFNLMKIKQL